MFAAANGASSAGKLTHWHSRRTARKSKCLRMVELAESAQTTVQSVQLTIDIVGKNADCILVKLTTQTTTDNSAAT